MYKTLSLHDITTLFQRAHLTKTMALNINNGLTILTIFSLFQPIGTSCNSLFNAKDITGIYCDDIGIDYFSMSFHDCKYICIHKAICTAINYDIEHCTCILLPVPCPQAITDQNMKYAIFSDPDQEHCIEWVNYTGSVVHDERWALTRVGGDSSNRVLARMLYNGTHYPGHMSPIKNKCYATNGNATFESGEGHPCQVLRVREGCTTIFIAYTTGRNLPSNVVIGGSMPDGRNSYISVFQPPGRSHRMMGGFYTAEDAQGVYSDGSDIHMVPDMELLVVI